MTVLTLINALNALPDGLKDTEVLVARDDGQYPTILTHIRRIARPPTAPLPVGKPKPLLVIELS